MLILGLLFTRTEVVEDLMIEDIEYPTFLNEEESRLYIPVKEDVMENMLQS